MIFQDDSNPKIGGQILGYADSCLVSGAVNKHGLIGAVPGVFGE
jgi:hypothetical protein